MGKVTVVKKCANFCTFISAKPTKVHNRSSRKDYVFLYMRKKTDKIKRSTLIQDYEKGGIKMIHIEKFIMSLKVTWINKDKR